MASSETKGWWMQFSQEKFWIESTDRSDIGLNLLAPISTNAYQKLVSSVKSGDIVFHYFQPIHSIVAFSMAIGKAKRTTIRWPDRINSPEAPGHTIDLTGYTELDNVITLSDIRNVEIEIRKIHDKILSEFGNPIYFPYQIRKNSPIRPAQGAYLSKFPVDLLKLFPTLIQEVESEFPNFERNSFHPLQLDEEKNQRDRSRKQGDRGWIRDELKKKAIEIHAMKVSINYLKELGYTTEDVSNFRNIGYDIEAFKPQETVGVEVKGSSIAEKFSIDLSKNEVDFALASKDMTTDKRSLLLLVEGIQLTKVGDAWEASGGVVRPFWDWFPKEESLIPTGYRYVLPKD